MATKLPAGVERRLAESIIAMCKRFRVSVTGKHGGYIGAVLLNAYELGRLMRDDEATNGASDHHAAEPSKTA